MQRAHRLVLSAILILGAGSASRAQFFDWAFPLGNASSTETMSDLTLDAVGNVYLAGSFAGAVDFDPGADTFALGATSLDAFVAKYTKDTELYWAVRFGGVADARAWTTGVAVDLAGNVYVVGQFEGTVDFDPGTGVANLTTTAGRTESWVVKLDSAGGLVWARRIGGATFQYFQRVRVDAAGNVYSAGHFSGTADFDPGPGTFPLTSGPGTYATFLQKLDAGGNFLWARALIGANGIYDYGLDLASGGDLVLAGYFHSTVDFDPGPGVFNLTSAGSEDAWVARISASGAFVWARSFGSTGADDVFAVATDADGNVFATGRFQGTVDFDPGLGVSNLTAGGFNEVFVSKLGSDGSFSWARQFGGPGSNYQIPYAVAVDAAGQPHVAGSFIGTADFDPGAGTFSLTSTPSGGQDVFVATLDGAGGFLWAARLGGCAGAPCDGGEDVPSAVAVDATGHTYTVGNFRGAADFDPATGSTFLLNSQGGSGDGFVSKLSPQPISGVVPDGASAPGAMLTVNKVTGGNLRLSWGASCRVADNRYELYEGTLGNFTSHVPLNCSATATILFFTPGAGDRYYLVVPTSGTVEGSYGVDGDGNERPPSAAACHPQSSDICMP